MEASFCGADRGTKKDQHFTTEYLMLAGQKLLEALLVYCKIDVSKYYKDKKPDSDYCLINYKEIENELSSNKKLIDMTNGREDGESSGSDSQPSEDNLDEEELATVVPIQKKPEKKVAKPAPPKPKPIPTPVVKKVEPPSSPLEKRRPVKEIIRPQVKKPMVTPPFDRLHLRKRKPDMKDAWTQTTPRSKDERRRQK